MVEPGEVKQSNYLNKDWSAGESTSSGCDKMTIKEPRTQFLFGYTLLARYQNSYWNPNYGKIQELRVLKILRFNLLQYSKKE